MADISSDQALNELNIKTDSLPDNWLVSLINPVTGVPAENMTIARFIELLTSKQPIATNEVKGLMPKEFVQLNRLIVYKELQSNEEFQIPRISGSYGLYYISLLSSGTSALYRSNHYKSILISGENYDFSETFGEKGKVSFGIKSNGGESYIFNGFDHTITFSLRIL